MVDERIKILADKLVNYSCHIKKGENCLIELIGADEAFGEELIKAVNKAGGNPYLWVRSNKLNRALLMKASEEQLKLRAEYDAYLMSKMDAYIGVRAGDNSFELSDVPQENMEAYSKIYWEPVHGALRVAKTKWVILRYPNGSMSQLAKMSTEKFENFYFDVCNLDYEKMSKAMDPLVELMNKTDKVRIVAKDTDISFSIKDIPAIKCDGFCNIPDGEIYTAPVKNSVNGVITYNTPSVEDGFTYEKIRFEFKDGKIINATANDTERINKLLNTDEGARYVGEFAIGVNPYINVPMLDTLFDEKIAGSIHFTPGSCYDDAPNGNHSAVHWDLVLIQTEEYGGGEIWFDDVLIRKNGIFVLDKLKCLNPENLK
ncbi:MAG: aminopeptidase [Clostridiales bacterium]|nr:aminopeptidase [Clostridiales bacterium]